jgi:hypothetical protein
VRQTMASNMNENGERSAGWRRTVVEACFQQNTGHWRPSQGNARIRSWSLQDAGLQRLRHPVYGVLRQMLPNLFRRRMFVQGLYRIGRRTLRRTIASSYAHSQGRHGEDDDERARSPGPATLEICQMQHSRLTGPAYFLPYRLAWTQATRSNYRNWRPTSFDTWAVRLVALSYGRNDWRIELSVN